MKEKITLWTQKATASSKNAWMTLLIALAVVFAFGLIVSLIVPLWSPIGYGMTFGIGVAITIAFLILVFISFMIKAGFLAWAAHIIDFEKKGFERALGAVSVGAIVTLVPFFVLGILATVFFITIPILLILAGLLCIGLIALSIFVYLHIFSVAYELSYGKALSLLATGSLLQGFIIGGLYFLGYAIAIPIILQVERNNPYSTLEEMDTWEEGDYQQVRLEAKRLPNAKHQKRFEKFLDENPDFSAGLIEFQAQELAEPTEL